jgi:outer membrane protein assembly factor BamB
MRVELSLPLSEAWSVSGGGLGWGPMATPVLAANGLAFTCAGGQRLVALDAGSGERVWEYPWACLPCVLCEDRLYASTSDELHAIEIATGRPTGCIPCPRPARVALAGALVLILSEDYEYARHVLICLELASGRWIWTRPLPKGDVRDALFAVRDDLVVVSQADGTLLGLDLVSGEVRWSRSWPEWAYGNVDHPVPACACRLFLPPEGPLVAIGGRLLGLDARTGATRWQVEDAARFPYLYEGRLYDASYDGAYSVRSAKNGAVLLAGYLAKKALVRPATEPRILLVSETHAFLSTERGGLLAVARHSGAYAWHHEAPGEFSIAAPPVVVGQRLYYHRQNDRLFCLAPRA